LAAQLEAQGYRTDFFDLSMDELPEDGDFDQLWLSGSAAWANPEGCRDLPYDVIVAGEADHPDTVRAIVDRAAFPLEDRIMYVPTSPTLDWVLPPVRRWAKRYHSHMPDREGRLRRMTSLFTSRGCPMECAFCESGRHGVIWDQTTRYEPIPIVEEQIRESVEQGFEGLAYYDDIFIVNRRRTVELLELHKKYDMVFRCFLRSDILVKHGGRDYLEAMVEGGLIEAFVGVESADNQIKANITKGTTIEQDTAVLEWCKELGVTCKMSFILGLPGETRESMERTRAWILKHRPERVQVDRLIPFPGTPLTDHPEKYDLTYETRPDEDWFFRGRRGAGGSFVSTSELSVEEIDEFWSDLEDELHREGLMTFSESERVEAVSMR
jgi:radical SAM superfamily enzyme YgiQ (UPF0313 family)